MTCMHCEQNQNQGMNFCPNCGRQFTKFHENRSWKRERAFALWGIFSGLMGGLIGNFIVQSIYFKEQITNPINSWIFITALFSMAIISIFLIYYMWKWLNEE